MLKITILAIINVNTYHVLHMKHIIVNTIYFFKEKDIISC